jgi:hypothetical protein
MSASTLAHSFTPHTLPDIPSPQKNTNQPNLPGIGDDIFDWSCGAASLPAPPRRTLQRMGVPEQLRQFFLLKVRWLVLLR